MLIKHFQFFFSSFDLFLRQNYLVNGCLKSDFISNVFPGFCSSMKSQCLRLPVNILKIVLCWYPGSLHELFCQFFSKYMFYPLWTSCCLFTCREEQVCMNLWHLKRFDLGEFVMMNLHVFSLYWLGLAKCENSTGCELYIACI